MSPEMKKSMKKYKNLPATHGVGVRYAEKSGKAVLTKPLIKIHKPEDPRTGGESG